MTKIILPSGQFAKLATKIKRDIGHDTANYERMYRGNHQSASGMFSWTARTIVNGRLSPYTIGSSYTVKELLKYSKLTVAQNSEIVPEF